MKLKLLIISYLFFSSILLAQETLIPDTNFENYLETHDSDGNTVSVGDISSMGNGVANDNYVKTANISSVITLNIANQSINSLVGIGSFQSLQVLNFDGNTVSSIDLTMNLDLLEISAISNNLANLNLRSNTKLERVDVADNNLISFDFRNGNNGIIKSFRAIANYNLPCITVDNTSLSSLSLWNIDSGTSFSEDCNWTNVPDDNFENYLETHDANGNVVSVGDVTSMGNGVANDNYVHTSKIQNVLILNLSDLGINNLTGIENFKELQDLNCYNNGISSINLLENVELNELNISRNSLTNLDVSKNILLTKLTVSRNSLTSIDVTKNINLTTLSCSQNKLNSIDVTKNLVLKSLYCYSNPLGSLNVTKNTVLENLDCVESKLTSIDLSNNKELKYLQIYDNLLTSLDVSNNVKLIELYAEYNQIRSLDVSKNKELIDLSCFSNQLTYLNIRNGNNTNLDNRDFDIRNNPGLSCVSVDNPTYATTTFTKKDAQTSFNTFCSTTYVPDDGFEAYLETHNSIGGVVVVGDPNSMGNGIANDNYVGTEQISNIKGLNISGQGIVNFTGLEGFLDLEVLRCFNNPVANLNLSSNTKLIEIDASNMGLSSLNTNNLIDLSKLRIDSNRLANVNVSSNTNLEYLQVSNNLLNSIDVSRNISIRDLRIADNSLTTLDILKNINLVNLYCADNSLTSLNLTNNTLLKTLSCGKNKFTTININDLINLTDLFIEDTPTLSFLNVSNNINLEDIGLNNNSLLTSLDLSANVKLIEVYINNTSITNLNFSNSPDLYYLECKNNDLTSLNLKSGSTIGLDDVYATGNPKLICINVDDPAASYLSSWEKDTSAKYAEYCQLTYVPNDNFEALLEGRGFGNGIANDNYVYTDLISSETVLIIQDKEISDLTGIEDFESLEVLLCRRSNVETINVSNNIKLTHLNLVDNSLKSLDLSKNGVLEQVLISNNSELGVVDVSSLSKLTTLDVSNTGINSIDVSNNSLLKVLNVNNNQFTALDISPYPNIVQLRAINNQLTVLNIANGNNTNFTWFDVTDNSNLRCIEVDDVGINFNSGLWNKDASASYTLYCELTYIADAKFENYLETHDKDGNLVNLGNITSLGNGIADDNQVATSKIKNVLTLNVASQNIADLTGIEAFISLESLNCDYNDLTTLNLSSNVNLKILNAAENDFESLDFTNYIALEEVNLRSNSIASLLVNNNPNLKKLNIGKNALITLNLTSCVGLEELLVHQNLLVILDIRNGTNNLITNLTASLNPSLTCILVDDINDDHSLWSKDASANYSETCNTVVWSGGNDSSWGNTGNWVGNNLPLVTNDVVIPSLVSLPVIGSGVLAVMNDLTIENYSGFNISNGGVTLVNGNLDTDKIINIQSSETTSGVLIVKGTSNGFITYERAGLKANKWSMVTAPVSGQSIKEFIEAPENNIRINTTVTPNRYAVAYYDDTKADGSKWVYYTKDDIQTNTLTFDKGKGYIVSRATNGSIKFTGTLTTTDASISVNEEQWNSIGNPYTAFLPINNNSNENFIQENINKFHPENIGVYIWDNLQNKYVAKSLVSSPTSLTVGQGFFIKTRIGMNTINFKKSQQNYSDIGVSVFSKNSQSVPSIQVFAENKGVIVDTHIKYYQTATIGLDPGYDIGNFGSSNFDLYTHLLDGAEEKDFTIQSLPSEGYENMVIPLGVKSKSGNQVSISITSNNLPKGLKVYIEDKKLNKFIEIKNSQTKYTVTFNEDVANVGRFFIHTKASLLSSDEVDNSKINIYATVSKNLVIKGVQSKRFTVTIYNTTGVNVLNKTMLGVGENKIDLNKLPSGAYVVKTVVEDIITTKKIIIN